MTDSPPVQQHVPAGSNGEGRWGSAEAVAAAERNGHPIAARCRCDTPLAQRYGAGPVCWYCWQLAKGGDGSLPEPELDDESAAGASVPLELPHAGRVNSRRDGATRRLIEQLTRALGPPIAAPEMVSAGNGEVERARYRVFRWACPACNAGYEDELDFYSPFVVDSDGLVWCEAPHCSGEHLAATIRELVRRAA